MTHFSLTEKRKRRKEVGKEGKKRGKRGRKKEGKKERRQQKECKRDLRLKKTISTLPPPPPPQIQPQYGTDVQAEIERLSKSMVGEVKSRLHDSHVPCAVIELQMRSMHQSSEFPTRHTRTILLLYVLKVFFKVKKNH